MKAKYKVGDYIARHDSTAALVLAVIEGNVPLYGVQIRNADGEVHAKIKWLTEYETDTIGYAPYNPDFKLWASIEQGDIITIEAECQHPEHKNGHEERRKVLARVGDLIIMSHTPVPHDVQKGGQDIAEQLDDLLDTGGKLTGMYERGKEKMKPYITTAGAWKTADEVWYDVHTLALMNWRLLRE